MTKTPPRGVGERSGRQLQKAKEDRKTGSKPAANAPATNPISEGLKKLADGAKKTVAHPSLPTPTTASVGSKSASQGDVSNIEAISAAVGAKIVTTPAPAKHHRRHHKHVDDSAVFFLLLTIIGAQLGLYFWKKFYYRSWFLLSLLGLWLIPIYISLKLMFLRFVVIWFIFSGAMGYLIFKASQRPLDPLTPRRIYGWFYWCHKALSSMAVGGYLFFMVEFLGFSRLLGFSAGSLGIMMLFYGLYFGVVARDTAELCCERMAIGMGYWNKGGMPRFQAKSHICTICGMAMWASTARDKELKTETVALTCGHTFHAWCLKGWVMIGKKDTCPLCGEKVDMSKIVANPWDKSDRMWTQVLDGLRYLIVWNPVIVYACQHALMFWGLGDMIDDKGA